MRLLWLVLALWLASPAAFADRSRVQPPNPLDLVDSGCISFAFLQVRADDPGCRSALLQAKVALQGKRMGGLVGLASSFLGQAETDSILFGFLPFQGVRLDRLDEQGQLHSCTVVTITGFPGLQSLFWSSVYNDAKGQPYPTQEVGKTTVILRPRAGQPPEKAESVARHQGSFYAFSDASLWDRYLTTHAVEPRDPIYARLDMTQDTCGVLFNRQGSILRFLRWVDRGAVKAVEASQPNLSAVMESVQSVTWSGDVVDDDNVELQLRIQTGQPESVVECLKAARPALQSRGRQTEMQITEVGGEVFVALKIGGNRKLLMDYIERREPI